MYVSIQRVVVWARRSPSRQEYGGQEPFSTARTWHTVISKEARFPLDLHALTCRLRNLAAAARIRRISQLRVMFAAFVGLRRSFEMTGRRLFALVCLAIGIAS